MSRHYVLLWVVRFALCVTTATLGGTVPLPGVPEPVAIVASLPLLYGVGGAVALPSSLTWMGEPIRLRLLRAGTLVIGSGTILAIIVPLVQDESEPLAIMGSALLVEAGGLLASRIRVELAWIVAAMIGLALPVYAGSPQPLYLSLPPALGAGAWVVAAIVYLAPARRPRRF